MKPFMMLVLAAACIASPAFGQDKKTEPSVNFQTELYVTIVLREKLVGNEILSIEKQEAKLIEAFKANDWDPLGIEKLATKEEQVTISEKVTATFKLKYLVVKSKTSEELGILCETLAKLDVHEIYIAKNKTVEMPTAGNNGTTTPPNAINITSPSQNGQPATVSNGNETIAKIIARLLDISVLVMTRK